MLASSKKVSQIPLSPKLKLLYKDIKLVYQAEYYHIYEAIAQNTQEVCSIRILDLESEFYKHNPSLASTLFIQELLRICIKYPDSVLPEHFEINNHVFSFITKKCCPLAEKNDDKAIDIEKMIRRICSDMNFLIYQMKLADAISIDLENLYLIDKQGYLLSDWSRFLTKKSKGIKSNDALRIQPGSSEIDEVYLLGMRAPQLNGISKDNLEPLASIKIPKMHNAAIDSVMEGLNQPEHVKKILRKMLDKDPRTRLRLYRYDEEIRELKLVSKSSSKDSDSSNELKHSETIQLRSTTIRTLNQVMGSNTKSTSSETFSRVRPAKKEMYGINRFTKQMGGWACYGKPDAITFKCSKDIQLLGVGLFIPKSSASLSGTLQIFQGESIKQEPLVTKEVSMTEDMSDAEDRIHKVMFARGIAVKEGELMTVVCQLGKGPSFNGVSGMETVICDESNVMFTFIKNSASTNGTDVSNGQIPELYYRF